MNPSFAGISKHSESNLGKKGYKKATMAITATTARRISMVALDPVFDILQPATKIQE